MTWICCISSFVWLLHLLMQSIHYIASPCSTTHQNFSRVHVTVSQKPANQSKNWSNLSNKSCGIVAYGQNRAPISEEILEERETRLKGGEGSVEDVNNLMRGRPKDFETGNGSNVQVSPACHLSSQICLQLPSFTYTLPLSRHLSFRKSFAQGYTGS